MATILADDILKRIFLNENFITSISGNGLLPFWCLAIIWTNADPVHRRIYAALGGYELNICDPSNTTNMGMFYKIVYLSL